MFKCQKCGACCRDLLIKVTKNITCGLFLLPEETKLFLSIKPMWGFGLKGRSRPRPQTIGIYQFPEDTCPYLTKDNLCDIYEKRPKICRSFPLTVNLFEAKASVENRCPGAKQIPQNQFVTLGKVFPDDILKANAYIHTRLGKLMTSTDTFWLYDLKAERWRKVTPQLVGRIRKMNLEAKRQDIS